MKRFLEGVIVGDKCLNTRLVLVNTLFKHPMYHKFIKKSKKIMIDDPNNKSKLGDKVRITPCRPISKRKRWRLLEII